jgi:CRISPR-associated endonuclease/helicase Cas3
MLDLHFEQLTGFRPLSWQTRLFNDYLAGGRVPSAVDIPTGLGKTAIMALWLIARANGASLPRRLVYVVDRRAVVDQATAFAELLRDRLDSYAVCLKPGLQLDNRSLPISTLRGQFTDNREWLADPSQPAIIVGTVDMIGSRLLFEGYGVSRKMRPYHAGLLGADTLVLLDEAHLVPPFERLIEQIASGVDANGRSLRSTDSALIPVVPPLNFISLSATGRSRKEDTVFSLINADAEHPIVKRRLSAPKGLVLKEGVEEKYLAEVLAAHAWALTDSGTTPARVVVFCTSRDHAQKVQELLHKLASRTSQIETQLFVGGRRVYEREQVAEWLENRGFIAGSDKRRSAHATFVIATSAGEVGVDLDADHSVCDLVAWERMVQRLGRVNRRGEGEAVVIVVPAETDDEREKSRRNAVRELLHELPTTAPGFLDASPRALTALKTNPAFGSMIERASTPAPLHPPLTRALVEAWAMTSLEEHSGRPEVAPWIRGWPDEEEKPQTKVVWRAHLPVTDNGRLFGKQGLEAFRDAADPHLSEQLETETWRVLDWLNARIDAVVAQQSTALPEDGQRVLCRHDVVAVIFDSQTGRDRVIPAIELSAKAKRELGRALSGATLLVDRRLGGLVNGLLQDGAKEFASDITEIETEGKDRVVPFRVRRVVDADDVGAQEGWRTEASIPLHRPEDSEPAWLVIESLIGQLAESEEGRSGAKRAQRLDEHEQWAESAARRLAQLLVVAPEYEALLATSALLHDEGKQEERWQRAFNAPRGGKPPYAKTTGRPNLAVLDGYRHELGSLPYAEKHERVKALPPALRELCLHLIAAHHGSAHPLIRTSGAAEPPSRLIERAREIALRFLALQKIWGPWGLAWWEALLRAADQQASRRNDMEGGSDG